MLAELAASLFLFQTAQASPPADATAEERGTQVVEQMAEIFTILGSCERHFTPEQAAGVRRGFEPEGGVAPNAAQTYLQRAYEAGKVDTSRSAAFCQEVMRTLAASRTRSNEGN